MIRDPSDGSVRGAVKQSFTTATCKESLRVASGLPIASNKPENVAKLEKSREWLKEYRISKTGPSVDRKPEADGSDLD